MAYFTSKYKKNLKDTLSRLTTLLGREGGDQIFANFLIPTKIMKQFQEDYPEKMISDYPEPDKRIDFWTTYLEERKDIVDDGVPYIYASEFDQGLYGGLLGGEVRFLCNTDPGYTSSGWISSMVPPLLNDLSELDFLRIEKDGLWMNRYKTQLTKMVKRSDNNYGLSHIIAIDSFNFVFELVGATETYLAMHTTPDLLKRAIDFGYDLNKLVHDLFFEIAGLFHGGTCSWAIPWVPGRIICESLDPFHMTSIADFEKWGLEPIEKMFSAYDGGVIHLHANGWYLLEEAAKIKNLKAIRMVNEKGYEPAISKLDELLKKAKGVPLCIIVDFEIFKKKVDNKSLPGGLFFYVNNVPDVDTANRYAEKVRNYRV